MLSSELFGAGAWSLLVLTITESEVQFRLEMSASNRSHFLVLWDARVQLLSGLAVESIYLPHLVKTYDASALYPHIKSGDVSASASEDTDLQQNARVWIRGHSNPLDMADHSLPSSSLSVASILFTEWCSADSESPPVFPLAPWPFSLRLPGSCLLLALVQTQLVHPLQSQPRVLLLPGSPSSLTSALCIG